jgi:4-amino-4-deoxy-L-arabinose transferase-like glycosyltransferase
MRATLDSARRLAVRRDRALVWGAAALGALAFALPTLWWAAVNVEEQFTLATAPRSFASIVEVVWGSRGGGPVPFLVEHVTLSWPGGLLGLRLPSLVFLLVSLPAAGLVARELFGRREELVVVAALAIAPTAIKYSTEGRPPMLLLAVFLWSFWAALRAARLGGRQRWALAGAGLGLLVFVHPIGPLYACLALVAAAVHAQGGLRRLAREAWPAALLLVAALVPYFADAIDVLEARYRGSAAGASVRETATHAAFESLAPGRVGFVVLALAAVGLVAVVAERTRTGLVLALFIAAPIALFASAPTAGRPALFFDRYMIPALPVFLLLAAVGCERIGRVAGRGALPVAAVAAGLLVAEAVPNVVALDRMHRLELPRVADAVAADESAVLFGSSGTVAQSGAAGALTRFRPPRLVSTYVALARPQVEVVDETGCAGVKAFLSERTRPRRGVWLFYEAVPALAQGAAGRLAMVPGVHIQIVGHRYVLARSAEPTDPRDLVELGVRLRRAWRGHAPEDAQSVRMLAADREGLDPGWNCLFPPGLFAQGLSLRVP